MSFISVNNPYYFLTIVTHKRLPIFQTDVMKTLFCKALDEARQSAELSYFAYVIMPDHAHIITDSKLDPSGTLRYIKGISARRLIDHLKEKGHEASLRKLQQETKRDGYKYSLWEHHSDKFLITAEPMFMQKVNYIHNNPVKDGFVERPEDYVYSSSRLWLNKALLENEPLEMDIKKLKWRMR